MTLQEVCSNVSKEGIIPMLSKFDMVAVETLKERYFCYFVSDGTILAYPGEKGFSSFLESFGDTRDQGTPLREFNRKIAQEVMIIAPDEEEKVVVKHAYRDAEKVEDTREAEAILSLLLSAKEQVAAFQDKEQWMKKMKLKGSPEEWAPEISSSGVLTPLSIASLDLSFVREEAEISDPSVVTALKRNKRKDTTVFLVYIFVCPIPAGEQYPFAQIIYDKTHGTMIDAVLVEDYGKEHATFVDHLLANCNKDGTPSAIHCQDEWSFHLYRKIGASIGTMVVLDEKADETMDKVAESFVHALAGIVHDSVAHHDHDGCDCDHEHHD